MIGAVVFVISFVVFTLISIAGVNFPPGMWVHGWFNIPASEYSSLINGVVNGVVYGVIIWLVFSLAKMAWERKKGPKQPAKPSS